MFLEFMDTDDGREISKLARQSCTYNAYYSFWRDNLFERIMRLFVWENTGTIENGVFKGVKPKEIEQRLLLQGHCGMAILPNDNELTAFYGSFFGVGKYIDDKPKYTVRCPIYSATKTIGKDIVVIDNTSLRNPAYELVHHYATLLAHAEVTFVNILINARDSGGVPVAQTEKQKQSIQSYQGKIFNGQYGVVTDAGALGISYAGTDRRTSQPIMDIMITREKLIKSFYSDIGVRSAFEKRSNSVEAEVEADTSLLLLNLSDMIKCREDGCKAVNNMFGTNWSVHIAEEIDYGEENERVKFDTVDDIHTVMEEGDSIA